jgi:hypothetical protein
MTGGGGPSVLAVWRGVFLLGVGFLVVRVAAVLMIVTGYSEIPERYQWAATPGFILSGAAIEAAGAVLGFTMFRRERARSTGRDEP